MDETLWPARNVAEYAYCPRLFYYMEVEGIHVPSADTVEGVRVHRRVDSPSAAVAATEANGNEHPADDDPARPKSVRSLTLTSAQRGLTATLDIAEISGNTATPVEYRKGRPRRIAPMHSGVDSDDSSGSAAAVEPWPTDRIQVGLQAILLEEAGYIVPEAVLYYAAEKRRLSVPIDDALRRDAIETLAAARACAVGPRPLPLVNDPRCPRCSLQPVCLPDEVNFQRALADATGTLTHPAFEGGADEAALTEQTPPQSSTTPILKPRKIWPPRDDGIHVVAQENGTKIGVRGSAMVVSDKDGRKLKDVPLANVEAIALLGSVQISTQAVQTLADRGIPVAFLAYSGRVVAMIDPLDSVSAETRRAQVRQFDRADVCLQISRALIAAKIANQRTLLMRNHSDLPPRIAEDMGFQVEQAGKADCLNSVRGHEGQAAALYFGHFAGMVKTDVAAEFDTNGRQRRPAPDPVNAALSFAYSMLTHECTTALRLASLEPSIGAFHVSRPGRPALSIDLMEPFRPLISDSIVISAFNRGELKVGHFLRTAAGCVFTDAGRKAFFGVYGRRMADEVTHPVFGYKLSYRRMIILHARMLAAWLLGEIPTLAFLTTR